MNRYKDMYYAISGQEKVKKELYVEATLNGEYIKQEFTATTDLVTWVKTQSNRDNFSGTIKCVRNGYDDEIIAHGIIRYMFSYFPSDIDYIDLSEFNITYPTGLYASALIGYVYCTNLIVDLKGLKNITYGDNMFGSGRYESLTIKNLDLSNIINFNSNFAFNSYCKTLDLSYIDCSPLGKSSVSHPNMFYVIRNIQNAYCRPADWSLLWNLRREGDSYATWDFKSKTNE